MGFASTRVEWRGEGIGGKKVRGKEYGTEKVGELKCTPVKTKIKRSDKGLVRRHIQSNVFYLR
jgi:hypothetical protein